MFPGPLILILALIALLPLVASAAAARIATRRIQDQKLALKLALLAGSLAPVCILAALRLLSLWNQANTPPSGAGNPWGMGGSSLPSFDHFVGYAVVGAFVGLIAVAIRRPRNVFPVREQQQDDRLQ